MSKIEASRSNQLPDARGHFGAYGGQYVPETLMHPLEELVAAYDQARQDPQFQEEFAYLLKQYVGRPTPLMLAGRLTEHLGVRGFTCSAKTSAIPARIKSIMLSVRY